jgi:hypothetical protein
MRVKERERKIVEKRGASLTLRNEKWTEGKRKIKPVSSKSCVVFLLVKLSINHLHLQCIYSLSLSVSFSLFFISFFFSL